MFNLTLQAMQNFIIKTHKPDTLYLADHFYVLNKGLNSGKPLNEPCPNCFVVIFQNAIDKDSYYWLAYSLWKARYWHQFLVGSVIPFLRIDDFRNDYSKKTALMLLEHDEHLKNVKALKLLEQKEHGLQKNITLINELRRTILSRYCSNY
jgi:hypothetical protein